MALTPDFDNLIIHSDASVTDAIVFHEALRGIEESAEGMLHPVIHTYKEVPLGGGALFPAIAFINGWTFQLPAGNWTISGGNMDMTINPVAGCYVKQTQSAAYAVTYADGGGGATGGLTTEEHDKLMAVPTAAANASATLAAAQITPIHSDVRKVNAVTVAGTGTPETDPWRPAP